MNRPRRAARPALGARIVVGLLVWMFLGAVVPAEQFQGDVARELDTRRLLGTAYYENGDYKSAADEFRRCIELDSDSPALMKMGDRFNLALVLIRAAKYPDALRRLKEAEGLGNGLLAAHYLRGIVYKRQDKFEQAVESLKHVVARDPECWGALYNLGICHKLLKQYEEATTAFEAAVKANPNHPSAHYQLMLLSRRARNIEEARRHAKSFNRLKNSLDPSEKTAEALERSKYSYLMPSPRLIEDRPARAAAPVRFTDATAAAGLETPPTPTPEGPLPLHVKAADYTEQYARDRYLPLVGGAVILGDYDGDGDLDVYLVNCALEPNASGNRLYRNQGDGRFADVTAEAGVGDQRQGMNAVFGDYDNDGHNDLYVVNYGPNVLYHNQGDGTFADVSQEARVDEPQFGRQAVFCDYDHDHDLDILVINDVELSEPPSAEQFVLPDDFPGQVNTLLRNNGNGTFLDQTDEAGLLVDFSQSRAVLFADFDRDYDIDLFVCNADSPSLLFLNARLGKLAPGGSFSPPIPSGAVAAAEGDFDRDGNPDLLVAVGRELYLYTNRGKADFQGTPVALADGLALAGVGQIEVFDYDNDGWPDLLLVDREGRSMWLMAGAGPGRFRDVSSVFGLPGTWGRIADLATGDLDADGDQDILLLTRGHQLRLLRNNGRAGNRWIDVHPAGERENRSGYGATVEVSAPGYYQKQTVRDGPLHFGLGDLDRLDVVRIIWPNGIAQNMIRPPVNCDLKIRERVKVSASCTFLWAHNGTRFELVNEILGIGPLGVPMAPGVYHPPDCTELTKIEAHQLVPREGMYELRLTEELREVTYADRMSLRVVDHPAELEIIPNEMFTAPPFPEDKLFAVGEPRAVRSAVDDRGADVLPLIQKRDGRFPTFPLTHYGGLARPHEITLDLGDLSGEEQIMLYLDGWIYWAESSTVMAIAQDPRFAFTPLSLEVRDRQGRWHTAIESVGLPTSKGMVVPVDLSGRFLCDDYRVRLATNMCVYFDRIFVSTNDQAHRCEVTELPVAEADLHYRGFSSMTRDSLGFERFDYQQFTAFGSWGSPEGMLTRYGPVTSLLGQVDNRFVIFGPGDELVLRFDGRQLPDLPPGWVRDFVFYANGWVKDGDLNTALSDHVGPLPFHGMSGYPYPPGEHYPRAAALKKYLRTYNTRPGATAVGRPKTP